MEKRTSTGIPTISCFIRVNIILRFIVQRQAAGSVGIYSMIKTPILQLFLTFTSILPLEKIFYEMEAPIPGDDVLNISNNHYDNVPL